MTPPHSPSPHLTPPPPPNLPKVHALYISILMMWSRGQAGWRLEIVVYFYSALSLAKDVLKNQAAGVAQLVINLTFAAFFISLSTNSLSTYFERQKYVWNTFDWIEKLLNLIFSCLT